MPDLLSTFPPPGAGLAFAAIAALTLATWIASVVRRDASLVDRMWPVFFAAAAAVYVWTSPAPGARALATLALVGAWAVRLCAYITHRNWGHGEDRRYQEIRARNEPGFAWKSLYLVYALQAVLSWAIAWPVGVAVAGAAPLGALDAAGLALGVFGLAWEAVGDAQMARFKAQPANRGRVMDTGLWRLSRHPNYFGEACLWWGVWLLAIAGGGLGAAWTVVSPLLITTLLLKVSGVALLEKDIAERRPAYRRYIEETPAFVPGWPRRRAPKEAAR
jgi:steroid 5-alpha reductase family enzyme